MINSNGIVQKPGMSQSIIKWKNTEEACFLSNLVLEKEKPQRNCLSTEIWFSSVLINSTQMLDLGISRSLSPSSSDRESRGEWWVKCRRAGVFWRKRLPQKLNMPSTVSWPRNNFISHVSHFPWILSSTGRNQPDLISKNFSSSPFAY